MNTDASYITFAVKETAGYTGPTRLVNATPCETPFLKNSIFEASKSRKIPMTSFSPKKQSKFKESIFEEIKSN